MKAKSRAGILSPRSRSRCLLWRSSAFFVGRPSRMSFADGVAALFGKGSAANVRILRSIRVPRVLAALIAGAALSVSGLVMQTTLSNAMASPSTMGVSNAAVFGANLSIIVFAGGFLSTGNNLASYTAGVNPFAASVTAFLFSALSILLILALCRVKAFSPNVVVLAGIAVGATWSGGNDASAVLRHGRRPFRPRSCGISAISAAQHIRPTFSCSAPRRRGWRYFPRSRGGIMPF